MEGGKDAVPPLSLGKAAADGRKERGDMLRRISPRKKAPAQSPNHSPMPPRSPPVGQQISGTTEKKRFTLFGKKKDEEPTTSIPSAALNNYKSPPSTPGSASNAPYVNLIWGQVLASTSSGSEDDGSGGGGSEQRTRSLSRSRNRQGSTGRRAASVSGGESESGDDSSLQSLVPMPLIRGQMVLLLDSSTTNKHILGFCGGRLGRLDRANVSLMEEHLSPRCPKGDSPAEWDELLQVMQKHEWLLFRLLLEVVPSTLSGKLATFALALMNMEKCDGRGLLKLLIRTEVKNTSEYQMLFRGNTVASKVLSQFAKTAGIKYLDLLMRPLIRSTVMMGFEAVDFAEFDRSAAAASSKLSPRGGDVGSDSEMDLGSFLKAQRISDDMLSPRETSSEELARREKNDQVALSVWESTEMLLEALYASVPRVPEALRAVARDMAEITGPKFPEQHLVLAGFFVLRFIAPAVATPVAFGLDCCKNVSLTADAKKRLLQVSKVAQAVANNQAFKESSHLAVLNDKVLASNVRLRVFFEGLLSENGEGEQAVWKQEDADGSVLESFWGFVVEALPGLGRRVVQSEVPLELSTFAELIDTLTGLPMSRR